MKYIRWVAIAMMMAMIARADIRSDDDRCTTPDVYGDWSSVHECVEHYAAIDKAEADKHKADSDSDNQRTMARAKAQAEQDAIAEARAEAEDAIAEAELDAYIAEVERDIAEMEAEDCDEDYDSSITP